MNEKELQKMFESALEKNEYTILKPLITEYVRIKDYLDELSKLPMIKVNPKDKMQQKQTVSSRERIKYSAQLSNITNILLRALKNEGVDGESPLMKVLKQFE